jgi:hypothetical protein
VGPRTCLGLRGEEKILAPIGSRIPTSRCPSPFASHRTDFAISAYSFRLYIGHSQGVTREFIVARTSGLGNVSLSGFSRFAVFSLCQR